MTILVNWPAAAVIASGLAVLLGLTWLLRGARATARMCGVVGVTAVADGLATGRTIAIPCGVIILAVVWWCFRSLRRDEGWR